MNSSQIPSLKIYAHRGFWWPDHAQNSKEAIVRARELGADGVEVDLRMTLDGELVLCHDKSFRGLEVANKSLAEIWGFSQDAHLAVPLIDEALLSYDGLINLEVKRDSRARVDEVVGRLAQTMKTPYWERKVVNSAILFSSFDLETLKELAKVLPGVPRYLLLDRADSTRRGVREALRLGCEGVNIHYLRASSFALSLCREHALKVGLWTLDDPIRANGFCYSSVSNIITNRVDLLVKGQENGLY